jgi:SpoVK/Ycf46/Vps4 family AAA+-type ATPase
MYCTQIIIFVNTYPNKKDITFLEEFNKKIKKFTKELERNELIVEEKNIFYTVAQNENDFVIKKQKIKDFVLDIELNYGKEFLDFHNNLYDHLKNKTHGLTLLYGDPGTGKTFYSKYLISLLCNDKDIIYVPSFLIEQLSNPDFISFIENNKNSILIIEDAEFVLSKREDNYNSQAVSNLLNITSGLLNDISGIQVIATFNMKKENIDDALLRPGRLVAEHKFELLKPEEATLLSNHLEKNITYTKNVSIAEVYEGKENLHKKTKKRISLLNDTETTPNNE